MLMVAVVVVVVVIVTDSLASDGFAEVYVCVLLVPRKCNTLKDCLSSAKGKVQKECVSGNNN